MGLAKIDRSLLLRLAEIWWRGFKVLCRLSVFWIVLAVLLLPAMGLTRLVGEHVGRIFAAVLLALITPIMFYLTSRYLKLLRDDDRGAPDAQESVSDAGARRNGGMRDKIIVSTGAAFLFGFLLGPPDTVSQLTLGALAALLCGIPLLILARREFVQSSPRSMQTTVCVLVCLLSMAITSSSVFSMACRHARTEYYELPDAPWEALDSPGPPQDGA